MSKLTDKKIKKSVNPILTIGRVCQHWIEFDKIWYCDGCKTNIHAIKYGIGEPINVLAINSI